MSRVTIYSVARACGVSASTVSRAFSRPDVVRPAVREQILATAERLGYHTNKTARSLATGRTGTIGLLVPDITNPFFPPLVRAIQRAAADRDSSVMLVDAEESAAAEVRLIEQHRGQVDGLIVAAPRSASALTAAVSSVPTVLVNRRMRGIPAVICDNTDALQRAGDHLREHGHRRIALVRGPSASWSARQRANAVRVWAKRSKVSLTDVGAFAASFDGGQQAAADLLRTNCTAVFAFDDLVACGVLAGLAQAGERVPQDRALVGCEDRKSVV